MKIGTATPSEFQNGEGRMKLRRAKTASHLKVQAEKARQQLCTRISKLANLRMLLVTPWWHERYPKRRLEVRFGNGTCYASVDGKGIDLLPDLNNKVLVGKVRVNASAFQPLIDAINDVETITSDYMDGSPDDFVIERRKDMKKKEPKFTFSGSGVGRPVLRGALRRLEDAEAAAEAKVEQVFAQAEAANPRLVREPDGRYRARDDEERRAVMNLATKIVVGMAEKGKINPDNDHEVRAAMRRAVPMAFTAYRAAIDFLHG